MAWDPSKTSTAYTLSLSNRLASRSSGSAGAGSRGVSFVPASAKRYFELTVQNDYSGLRVGFANSSVSLTTNIAASTGSVGINTINNNVIYNSTTLVSNLASTATNTSRSFAVYRFAIDRVNNRFWVAFNDGQWNNSGTADPATNTGGLTLSPTGDLYPALFSDGSPNQLFLNDGTLPFSYQVPSGFNALSTPSTGETHDELVIRKLQSYVVLDRNVPLEVRKLQGYAVLDRNVPLEVRKLQAYVVIDYAAPPPPPSSSGLRFCVVTGG